MRWDLWVGWGPDGDLWEYMREPEWWVKWDPQVRIGGSVVGERTVDAVGSVGWVMFTVVSAGWGLVAVMGSGVLSP